MCRYGMCPTGFALKADQRARMYRGEKGRQLCNPGLLESRKIEVR